MRCMPFLLFTVSPIGTTVLNTFDTWGRSRPLLLHILCGTKFMSQCHPTSYIKCAHKGRNLSKYKYNANVSLHACAHDVICPGCGGGGGQNGEQICLKKSQYWLDFDCVTHVKEISWPKGPMVNGCQQMPKWQLPPHSATVTTLTIRLTVFT